MTNSLYVLLTLESRGNDPYKSVEDDTAELDEIGCSIHPALEAAKEAAQASLDKSLDDHLEKGEDREMLKWSAYGEAIQPPPEPTRWFASDQYAAGYRGYEIRLLSVPSIDAE